MEVKRGTQSKPPAASSLLLSHTIASLNSVHAKFEERLESWHYLSRFSVDFLEPKEAASALLFIAFPSLGENRHSVSVRNRHLKLPLILRTAEVGLVEGLDESKPIPTQNFSHFAMGEAWIKGTIEIDWSKHART
jgi:hypothetical protein